MNIDNIHWQTYQVPFAHRLNTAHGEMAVREGALITITTDEGMRGFGEIAPLPEFGGETLNEACKSFARETTELRGKSLETAWEKLPSLSHAALSGLEIALLDIQGKLNGRSVGALLSKTATRATIPVNAVVGARSTADAVASALTAKKDGFTCIKLKVGSAGSRKQEIERIAAVRAAIGPDVHLRLDANEAWTLQEAIAILNRCVPYELQYVEQPLRRDDLTGMQQLRRSVPILIAADEALHDIESARHIMHHGAADILIIKPQLAGGLRASRQIISEATQRGLRCVVTTTIESGISLAAALHLVAASPEVKLACGLATQHLLVDDFIHEEIPIHNGVMTVPTGSGLGVTLDDEALKIYSSSSFRFHPL